MIKSHGASQWKANPKRHPGMIFWRRRSITSEKRLNVSVLQVSTSPSQMEGKKRLVSGDLVLQELQNGCVVKDRFSTLFKIISAGCVIFAHFPAKKKTKALTMEEKCRTLLYETKKEEHSTVAPEGKLGTRCEGPDACCGKLWEEGEWKEQKTCLGG